MKTLKTCLRNYIPLCEPSRLIYSIWGYEPFDSPKPASQIRCPVCNSDEGYYIPSDKAWCCMQCPTKYISDYKQPIIEILIEPPKVKDPLDEVRQSPEILFWARNWFKEPQGFAVFAGDNGTGKTFLAKALMRSKADSIMITQAEFNIAWKSDIDKWHTDQHMLDKYSSKEFLVLDDIGTRPPTDAFMDFLYALTDRRYRSKLPTIITTNLKYKEIREKFGDAFASRISSGKCFRFDGPDRRIHNKF